VWAVELFGSEVEIIYIYIYIYIYIFKTGTCVL
jgi:hypothetical protein